MSGAEVIAVVGLVSSIASLVELTTKIVSLVKECRGRHSSIGDTLNNIQRECNTIQTALGQITAWHKRERKDDLDSDVQSLKTAVDQYIPTLEKLSAELNKIQSNRRELTTYVFRDSKMKALLGDARTQSYALSFLVTTMILSRPERQFSKTIDCDVLLSTTTAVGHSQITKTMVIAFDSNCVPMGESHCMTRYLIERIEPISKGNLGSRIIDSLPSTPDPIQDSSRTICIYCSPCIETIKLAFGSVIRCNPFKIYLRPDDRLQPRCCDINSLSSKLSATLKIKCVKPPGSKSYFADERMRKSFDVPWIQQRLRLIKEDPDSSNVAMDKYLDEVRKDHQFDALLVLASSEISQSLLSLWTYENRASVRVDSGDIFELLPGDQDTRVASFFGTIDGV